MRWPPDDPADVRSDTPNRVAGTLRLDPTPSGDATARLSGLAAISSGWISMVLPLREPSRQQSSR
jgi:hypothetical protein